MAKKITVYAAIPALMARTEPTYDRLGYENGCRDVYPHDVQAGDVIGEFESVSDIYKHLRNSLSIDGARSASAMWGNKGYMFVSLYSGEGYAQNASGARINKYCQ